MKLGLRMPRPLAWAMIVVASLFIALGIVNLIINTDRPGSWLPLLVLFPLSLLVGVASLRQSPR